MSVDEALREREAADRPIRVGMVGARGNRSCHRPAARNTGTWDSPGGDRKSDA